MFLEGFRESVILLVKLTTLLINVIKVFLPVACTHTGPARVVSLQLEGELGKASAWMIVKFVLSHGVVGRERRS